MDLKTQTAKYKSNTELFPFVRVLSRAVAASAAFSRPFEAVAAKARKKPKHIEIQQSVTFGSSEDGVGEGERPRSGDKVGLRGR